NELYAWLPSGQRAGEDIKEAMVRRAKLKYPSPPAREHKKGVPLNGKAGILSGVVLDQDKIDAQIVADKKRARELQQTLANIDASFAASPYLNERLRKQATQEISKEARATFTRFQEFCAQWGMPCLPEAKPQAIALFIVEEAKDAQHARRLLNNLTAIYKKLSPPPYEDTLVKVIVEAFRDEEPKTH